MTETNPDRARSSGRWRQLAAACLMIGLGACGSPEEKQARYLERAIAFYDEGNDAKSMVEIRNVLQINPKNADAYYYLGLLHERAKRWPQAYAAYSEAVADRPEFLPAQVKIGTLGLLAGQLEMVQRTVTAIQKVDPEDPDGLALQGALAMREKRYDDALALGNRILAKHPDHENGVAVVAGAYQALGQSNQALDFLDQQIARNPKSAPIRLLKISFLEKGGDVAVVRQAYVDLIAAFPNEELYRLGLASLLQKNQDLAGAEDVLREATDSAFATARTNSLLVQLIYRSRGFAAAETELQRLIARTPKDPSLRFMLAELYSREKRPDQALSTLQTVVDDSSNETAIIDDAKAGMGQIYLAQNDVAKAKEMVSAVLTENGDHRGANFINGLVALREQKFGEAVRSGRASLRRDPQWLPGLKLVAEGHLRGGERDLAINVLNDIAAIDPKDIQVGETLAQLLTQRGDLDTALKVWNGVLAQSKNDTSALQARAQISIQRGNWTAAQEDISTLLASPEQATGGALLAGNMMIARKQFDESREWFTKAQTMTPAAVDPALGIVRSYLAQSDMQGATTYLADYNTKNPDNPVTINVQGELALQQKRYPVAREAFEKAIALRPDWGVPRQRLMATLIQEGRAGDAVVAGQAAAAATANNPEILNTLAGAQIAAGQPVAAIATFEQVLTAAPNAEIIINNIAALTADHAYQDPAKLQRALELASRFQTSSNPLFLDTLGWLFYRKADYPTAVTYLDRAVILAGERLDLRYHLGMALAKTGQTERARAELTKATQTDQTYDGLSEAKATLADLENQAKTPPTDVKG